MAMCGELMGGFGGCWSIWSEPQPKNSSAKTSQDADRQAKSSQRDIAKPVQRPASK